MTVVPRLSVAATRSLVHVSTADPRALYGYIRVLSGTATSAERRSSPIRRKWWLLSPGNFGGSLQSPLKQGILD